MDDFIPENDKDIEVIILIERNKITARYAAEFNAILSQREEGLKIHGEDIVDYVTRRRQDQIQQRLNKEINHFDWVEQYNLRDKLKNDIEKRNEPQKKADANQEKYDEQKQWNENKAKIDRDMMAMMKECFQDLAKAMRSADIKDINNLPDNIKKIVEDNIRDMGELGAAHYLKLYRDKNNPVFKEIADQEAKYFQSDEYKRKKDSEAKKQQERDNKDKFDKDRQQAINEENFIKAQQNKEEMLRLMNGNKNNQNMNRTY